MWAALDRDAIVKVRGGALVAAPMTHFLYPGVAGYEQAGGAAGPKVDYNEHPEGDMAVAAKYMKLAGYPERQVHRRQDPAGGRLDRRTAGSGWRRSSTRRCRASASKPISRLVDQSVMYVKYCTVPAQEIDVCPNAGWVRDFADPQTVLYVPFYGPAITPSGNSNWSQVNDPQINAAMEKAALVVGEPARARRVGEDRRNAGPARRSPRPRSTPARRHIEGKDVAGVNQLWNNGAWDYDFTSLK